MGKEKDMSDRELQDIVRRAENTNVAGSQYNRAKTELDMRHRTRMENKKEPFWSKFFWYFIVAIVVAVVAAVIKHLLGL